MKVATWNINSVRARQDRLLAWLQKHSPDILCLQELKGVEEKFPKHEIAELGYEAAIHGQPTYNGVAILSKQPIVVKEKGMHDPALDDQARLLHAHTSGIDVICVYVPNGFEIGSTKHTYKLQWLDGLNRYLQGTCHPQKPWLLCGDFNIAPEDRDVARVEEWTDSVLCDPAARERLAAMSGWGLVDTFRQHHEEGGFYSWWDYRQLAFPKGNGLRIDFVFASPALAKKCTDAWIDRNERKGKSPSDHAPVLAEFGS